jgi:hypothetical protein
MIGSISDLKGVPFGFRFLPEIETLAASADEQQKRKTKKEAIAGR